MIFRKTLFTFFLLLNAVLAFSQDFPPKPNHLVNDYTHTLSSTQVEQLEQKLVAFDDSTSTQIAVVIIKSLGGYDIADYAVRLAENWGIGGKKNNNGVLVLVSLGDRKVTIQTGYGIEGVLPDAIARRIIENEISPNFRTGNYYKGLDAGTSAIISYTKGEYKEPRKRKQQGEDGSGLIVFIIIMVIIFLLSKRGGGGGSRVIGGRGGASPFWWMLMGSGMGRSSGGGFGGFSGGGGNGGGFGGFGGGSFGGGGASGSW
ncbi:MAG TPA: TPM domain-containing protein [Daejeonella sp.]|nr:TPM domain-containing protein [Daejeonella sp.]